MKYYIILTLLLVGRALFAQSVQYVEYFFDQDPGFGQAKAVSSSALSTNGNDVIVDFTASINGLSEGLHTLFLRARDQDGIWSGTLQRNFLLLEPGDQSRPAYVEYFFDNDPGFGNATVVDPTKIIVSEDHIVLDFNADVVNLSEGLHSLFLRTRSSEGTWSATAQRVFLLLKQPKQPSPEFAEYFFDEDPGFGSGQPINLANALSEGDTSVLDFTAATQGLPPGLHTLYLRTRMPGGTWSSTLQQTFYIQRRDELSSVVALEYFIDEDPGYGNGIRFPIDSLVNPSLDVVLPLEDIVSGQHTLFIRAQDSDGVWSMVVVQDFGVCEELPAQAGFSFIRMGTEITLVDSAQYARNYFYTFGDGEEDSIAIPKHQYAEPGVYEVCQTVTNLCDTSTFCRTIQVDGVTSYAPKAGGNTGEVSLTIEGAGFNENTVLTLEKEGSIIKADTLIVSSDGTVMTTIIDLRGSPISSYDVVAVISEGDTARIEDGFQVEVGREADPWVSIVGRDALRSGRFQTYTLQYGNKGNTNAYGVPLWLAFVGDTTDIEVELNFDIALPPGVEDSGAYDTLDIYINVDSLVFEPLPERFLSPLRAAPSTGGRISNEIVKAGRVYPLLLPVLPAGFEGEISFRVKTNSGLEIQAWTTAPIYKMLPSYDNGRLAVNFEDVLFCFDKALKEGANELADVVLAAIPFYSCAKSALELPYTFIENPELQGGKAVAVLSWELTKLITTCATDVVGLSRAWKVAAEVVDLIAKHEKIVNVITSEECKEIFEEEDEKKEKELRIVNSFDPNEKSGYLSASGSRYFNEQEPFTYTIFYENVDTASAAAQEVFIRDTLDTKVFDLSTLTLGFAGFGDTLVYAPIEAQAFSTDIDLRPDMNLIVRMNASLDTTNGVVSWYFGSLDPETRELTEDPLAGFLPPNVNKGEGEGSVSFTIELKDDLPHGTVIENKAEIIFDLNKPIITPVWTNIKDTEQPVSAMIGGTLEVSDTTEVEVNWSGEDADAGMMLYDVYVSEDEGDYILWYDQTDLTSSPFFGNPGSTYDFYTIAYDSVYNQEAKSANSELKIKVSSTVTSTNDLVSSNYKIYPNPANEQLKIDFVGHDAFVSKTFKLVDLRGRSMFNEVTSQSSIILRTAHLLKGIYILSIRVEDQVYHHKILLE